MLVEMWTMVQECGWPAFLAIFAGVVAFVVGAVALVLGLSTQGKGGLYAGLGTLVLSLACVGVGAFGVWRGHAIVEDAVAGESIDPSMRERIRQEGYRESAQCLNVGLIDAGPSFLLGIVAILTGFARRKAA